MFIRIWSVLAVAVLAIGVASTAVVGEDKEEKTESKEKPASRKSKVSWESVKSASGKIESTTKRKGGNRYAEQAVYVEFTVASQLAFRIKYKLEPGEERGGKLKVSLEKEEERGKNKDWKSKGNIPARIGQEGEQVFTLGPGNYRLALTGEKTKYEFNVEEAVKTTE